MATKWIFLPEKLTDMGKPDDVQAVIRGLDELLADGYTKFYSNDFIIILHKPNAPTCELNLTLNPDLSYDQIKQEIAGEMSKLLDKAQSHYWGLGSSIREA